ncbi:hypothetical protein [Intrasporangium sp.]|uniref:hypothetical protein n=1 Tax=Intrasporangium sp. TaxID=1925024 RepID=UPI0033656666
MEAKTRSGGPRAVILVLVPLVLALAACGEVRSPATGGSTDGTVGATATDSVRDPGTVPADQPTTLPSASAPKVFADRAKVVAETFRASGRPDAPAAPVLLSPWADAAFETDAQKVAWAAGKVDFGSGVPDDQVGVSRMTLPDGSERPVDLLGPRESVTRALEGAGGGCSGVAAPDCVLTMTRATLTTMRVETNEGQATVPAWSFTVDGLARPIVVVAVAPGALDRPTPPQPLAGLPPAPPGFSPADSLDAVSGPSITVRIGHGACDRALTGHAVEFDDLVVVGATHTPPDPGTMCTMQYLLTPSTLKLSQPLGARVVLDVVSGKTLVLGVPPM